MTFLHFIKLENFFKEVFIRVSSCSLLFFDDVISFFFHELNTCALSSIFTCRQVLFLLYSVKYFLRIFKTYSLSRLVYSLLYLFLFMILSLSTIGYEIF